MSIGRCGMDVCQAKRGEDAPSIASLCVGVTDVYDRLPERSIGLLFRGDFC